MEKELTILSWPDYIAPETIEQFQAEFGVNVAVEAVPSAVELVERMRAPGPPPDLLCPPDYAVRELNADRRLLQLDHARLPNLEHVEPRFKIVPSPSHCATIKGATPVRRLPPPTARPTSTDDDWANLHFRV